MPFTAKHSWDYDQSFNLQNAKIILNTNPTSELDFLENSAIYLNRDVNVNEKFDSKRLCNA